MEGKIAIITGSTSGIGEAVAKQFAQLGCRVTVVGRDASRGERIVAELAAEGRDALFVRADLRDPAAPGDIVRQTVDRWGGIDIVVNNAALVCSKPVDRIVAEDWDSLFAVNVRAAFLLTREALPSLRRSKGAVINVSSSNAIRNCEKNLVYDTMKAALNHMTSGLALDLRKDGIRCNVIMPGGVRTPLLDQWFAQHEDYDLQTEKAKLDDDPSVATSEQIARIVTMVATDKSGWLNGAHILADGGYSIG